MKRRKLVLAGAAWLAIAAGAPAIAQEADPHAGHATAPAGSDPAPPPTPAADPHAGHAMPAQPDAAEPTADPHAGHAMPEAPAPEPASGVAEAAADPHAGHVEPSASAPPETGPHGGHAMSGAPAGDVGAMPVADAPAGTDLPAGDAPPPPVPTASAADAVYGAEAMHMGRHHLAEFHGGQKLYRVMLDTAEAQLREGRDGFAWDAEAWYGGDLDRLWLKSDGEGAIGGSIEKAEVQALYSRALDPYFNLQGGVRYDVRPDPSRAYAVIGIEGLAPGFFEVEGALFLSNEGEVMARIEGSYDQRITQRLILQPQAELNFAAQDSPEIGVGSGLSDAEIGLRLRYDVRREFAPYVGVQYRRAFGETRRMLQSQGEDAGGWSFLTGIRAWF
ncbi:MAG: copper resistance protein CopB [Sphingomonadales bacterium 12-68-11]|nr:MAG: copper resistance protein CopB [Sphingomonadales bacterium 12-68-11]OYX16851.1 MAG: copper resistance protein CopB [Sphingomonadales bacterium 32-67-7]